MAIGKLTKFEPALKEEIQYNVDAPGFKNFSKDHGQDIMHRDVWFGQVECGAFIDYDGYGDMLDVDLKLIGRIRPSQAGAAPPEFEWIIWYNR